MNKCYWCGKPSTRLCDFPVGWSYEIEDGKKVMSIKICSRPICDDCATNYQGLDACPKCMAAITIWALERKERILKLANRRADNGRD